jgi:hypothetical protein
LGSNVATELSGIATPLDTLFYRDGVIIDTIDVLVITKHVAIE